MKKALILGLAMSLAITGMSYRLGCAAAPEVSWNHQIVDVTAQEGLCDNYMLDDLASYIDKKVKAQATLPFVLKEKDESFGLKGEGFKSFIAMVPIIREDNYKESSVDLYWQGQSETYYKYVLRGQMDLIFCRFENGNINFLYSVPVFATKTLGLDVEEHLTYRLAAADLRAEFAAMMKDALDKQLECISPDVAKYLSERRLRTGTTQVVDVAITSPMALRNIPPDILMDYKKTIAGAYTSAYISKHPKAIMLPNQINDDKQWKQKVAANIQALAGIDKMDYVPDIDEEEECGPGKPIKLELNKLSTYQIPIKNSGLGQYYDYVGVAVGIRSSEDKEVLASYERKFLRGSDIKKQLMDILNSLMRDTAKELGNKK